MTRTGRLLSAGQTEELAVDEVDDLGASMLALDGNGEVTNLEMGTSACCGTGAQVAGGTTSCDCPPESAQTAVGRPALVPPMPPAFSMPSGCMLCGEELCYLEAPRSARCVYCAGTRSTQTLCQAGHFVCDACHSQDALRVIEHLCEASHEQDMVAMLEQVRAHPAIHVHGPEHHALVPAIMVATYRNRGGELPGRALQTALDRGAQVPGGFCGFAGACGAAVGVGIGFSAILGVNPYRARERRRIQQAAAAALADIGSYEVARCCQRNCWLALRSAARSSCALLPVPLLAEGHISCGQMAANKECLGRGCPLFVSGGKRRSAAAAPPTSPSPGVTAPGRGARTT